MKVSLRQFVDDFTYRYNGINFPCIGTRQSRMFLRQEGVDDPAFKNIVLWGSCLPPFLISLFRFCFLETGAAES